ncbi:MAG: response regulator [Mariprofundaceae bacterium]|nr:response regulator [Mariprofundaceae bacterium]
MKDCKRVLIIEDEENIQGILRVFAQRFFADRGSKAVIKTMSDSVQALFDLSTHGNDYDIIIMDVRLPKLGGDEIYNSMEQVNPTLLGRVLFVTGYSDDLTQRWPDRQLNILGKPFRYHGFEAILNQILAD